MSNAIITIQNVRGYLDAAGTAWINAEDVARGLGWTQTAASGNETIRWERLNGYLAEFNYPQKVGMNDFIPENMLYRLIWKSRDERALAFQSLVADEILPTIRRTGSYSIAKPQPVADMVSEVGAVADNIQSLFSGVKRGISLSQAIDIVSDYHDFAALLNLKQLLPPAEHETGYLNATQIGKKLGMKARRVNKLLADLELQQNDGDGWRLTEQGRFYGEEFPYTRNGHSGYQIRWDTLVVKILEDALNAA